MAAGKKKQVKRKTVTRRAGASQTRKTKSLRASSANRGGRKIQGATIEIPVNNTMAAGLQKQAEAHGFKDWKAYAKKYGKGVLQQASNVL